MNSKKTAIQKAKTLQAIIGLFLLIPAVLGVIFFIISIFNTGSKLYIPQLLQLSRGWKGEGASSAPIYMALMAMAGAYLIRDSLIYLSKGDE